MAVDPFCPIDTESFVLPSKSFYGFEIPVEHWQLRHYISSPEPGVLYFANEHNLYCLNTITKTRSLIASLPFKVRCTSAGYGWICAGGGEHGQFAIVRLDDGSTPAAEVDDLLPVEFSSRTTRRSSNPARLPKVKIDNIDKDIINSISIHQLEALDEETDNEVVAVFTSNDKTVRIYSLTYDKEAAVLELPFAINHSTISPNGKTLIAVGDVHQAYFYERRDPVLPASKLRSTGSVSLQSSWEMINIFKLHVPPRSNTFGYFSTAWSPNGRMCAVASECGYITVFNSDLIKTADSAEEAIIDIVGSSRADSVPGAGSVRSMCFSPQPWDLLIWAEDHGHVCVADLRSGLLFRQILKLDPNESSVHKVDVEDQARELSSDAPDLNQEADFIRRYRRALDVENNTPSYLEVAAERRRIQRMANAGAGAYDDEPQGLSHQERQILEALRTTRQREEDRSNGITPRSINYSPPLADPRPMSPWTEEIASIRSREFSNGGPLPSLASLREYLRERESDRDRYLPRRQASVVLPNDRSSSNSPHDASSRASAIPPHAQTVESSSSDAWRTIEAAMARSPSNTSLAEASADLQRHRAQREQLLRSSRLLSRYESGATYVRLGNTGHNPAWGLRVQGLAMSEDGRKLWVGSEKGIFEYEMNLLGRMSFPSVEAR